MKKFLLIACIVGFAVSLHAQTCPQIEGLTPIPLRFGTNIYGFPESVFPTVPLYWNRFFKVDELTGQLVSAGCSYTADPNIHELAGCACILTGAYFRSVTDLCDPTPCGGETNLPQLPITNPNNPASAWSQSATWLANQVPDISSSLSVMISKSTQVDVDLSFPLNHWLILTAGNSSVLTSKTITVNSIIQVYPAAQLENFGTIKGSGQINGSLINSGTLSPGNSPGKFTIVGNYTATGTAVHEIEIAAANLYDTINLTRDSSFPGGNASLNGTLNVRLLNGYTPSSGDSFTIMNYRSATGSFANANLPALPAGLSWSLHYNPTGITLQVNAVALPLSFLYTKAYRQNAGVQLTWGTADEINVKNFSIERSANGSYFNKVGTVDASGARTNNYNWFDASPAKGDNYYRIKANDLDGRFMYSGIQLINIITGKNDVIVYPNPVNRTEMLQLNLQNNTAATIEIINTGGQVLYSRQGKFTGNISIPVSNHWPAGQYTVRMIIENKTVVKKILLR
jgi:hypothetical protein